LRGPRFGRAVLFALPAACLGGTLAGLAVPSPVTGPAAAAATIVLGALVAADRQLPLALVVGLAILLGLLTGGIGGGEIVRARSLALGAGGLAAAPFVVIAVIAGRVASVQAWWARVAVRAAGSWIAAVGLLMLGWAIRRA
jgi:urease accessory protein